MEETNWYSDTLKNVSIVILKTACNQEALRNSSTKTISLSMNALARAWLIELRESTEWTELIRFRMLELR
jgi:hypothetical protein